jgi:hypothetical protein
MWQWRAAIVGCLSILVGVLAWFVFKPVSPDEVCLSVLPRKSNVGFVVDGKLVSVNIGALQESTGANSDQTRGFIECLGRSSQDRVIKTSNGVIVPRQPIGQLSDAWKGEQGGLVLTLEPKPNDVESNTVLQNIGIGPRVGTKASVVKEWCNKQAQACVACDPTEVSESSNQVIIRLKDHPPVTRRQMDGVYPPAPQNSHRPWEDVNERGERFYYECRVDP